MPTREASKAHRLEAISSQPARPEPSSNFVSPSSFFKNLKLELYLLKLEFYLLKLELYQPELD